MLLDIRRMFSRYDGPVHCEETVSMEGEDFPGYAVEGPVHAAFTAVLCGAVLELECRLQAAVRFECARCLVPVSYTHLGGGKLYPFQPPAQRQLFGRNNAEYHVGPGQAFGIEGLVV